MNTKDFHIVVVGATGTIGSKLSSLFIDEGYIVHCLGKHNDLKELNLKLMELVLINCAFSFSGSLEDNKKLLQSIMEFVKHNKVTQFINMTT